MYSSNFLKSPNLPFLSKFLPKTLAKPRSRLFARGLHQGAPEDAAAARPGTKQPLPWIRDRKLAAKKPAAKTESSWEAAAEGYLAKNAMAVAFEKAAENAEEPPMKKPPANRFGTAVKERSEPKTGRAWEAERNARNTRPILVRANASNGYNRGRNAEIVETRRSSWMESAEGDDIAEEEVEPVDNPRWSKIKSKIEFVERESRPEVRRWDNRESWGRKTWKEATESSVPRIVGQGVYGVGPVLAALSVARREFYALYVQEGLNLSGNKRKKKDKKGVEKILRIAEKIGLKVVEAKKHDMNMVVDNRPHQGLVLDASPLEMVRVKQMDPPLPEGRKPPLWVALDEVTDPQNLGAIIRSAYFFGADGVIMCAKNSAPLSGVVSKASAGSLELIELMSCKNMMQFLSLSVENGWRVLGGSVSSKAVPLREVEVGVPTILVLGSEGTGLRPLVESCCNQLIRIPGDIPIDGKVGGDEGEALEVEQGFSGQELKTFLAVESLNVSVAAGVLLYHLVGKSSHVVIEEPNVASKFFPG